METIKILNFTYKIEEIPLIDDDADILGQINHVKQTIFIRNDISAERKRVVLFHEVLHAILEQLGFVEEHDNEHLIDCLAASLLKVKADNQI